MDPTHKPIPTKPPQLGQKFAVIDRIGTGSLYRSR